MNCGEPPDDATVWRLLHVASNSLSVGWWATEDEAMRACASFTSPGVQGTRASGDAWVVVSDEPVAGEV